jgi:hypothetical protein
MRRAVSLLAAFALMWAGFAYAAHYHRAESAGSTDTHLTCLLCLHVDRAAGPAELPQASAPLLTGGTLILARSTSFNSQQTPRSYDARGPPQL